MTAEHLEHVLHPRFAGGGHTVLTTGLGASPGAAVGRAYFTADDAAAAAEAGEKVILVRSETSPEDVHGMLPSEGILTARGGLVSHAAVVARGWGKPAVVGAEKVRIDGKSVHRGRRRPWPRATGSPSTAPPATSSSARWPLSAPEPSKEFAIVLGWADEIRAGRLGGAGQRRHRRRRRQRPAARGRGDRPVPDRAHVHRRGPPARSCAA